MMGDHAGPGEIVGSRALTPGDIDHAIKLVASGAVDVTGFMTAAYPLDRTATAFEESERNPSRVLRMVIASDASYGCPWNNL